MKTSRVFLQDQLRQTDASIRRITRAIERVKTRHPTRWKKVAAPEGRCLSLVLFERECLVKELDSLRAQK